MEKKTASSETAIDMNKFRLRTFIEKLIQLDEVEIHDNPVPLSELSDIMEATPKAVLFRKAGPDQVELVGNVAASRSRLAAAFGVSEEDLAGELQSRLDAPQPVIEVASADAPVHQVIHKGEDADLTRLPFHPQHRFDGGTYISSGIDYTVDPETGITNVGCRRLSLKNKRQARTNVTAPSDLKGIYQKCAARGEKLPVNFAVGSHPLDYLAAGKHIPPDEVKLVGTLRGEPVPLVKAVTNDIRVPADVELVIEGYLDEKGYREQEGPYGEFMGYYGPMHINPIYHVTAITMRRDVLHQTVLHGSGKVLHRAESVNLMAITLEAGVRRILKSISVEPVAVRVMLSSGEGQCVRVAIRQTFPGQARNAIAALFGAIPILKHIFVVDEDIDVYSDEQFEWAFGTRFQADRDIVIHTGMRGFHMDPSLEGRLTGAKAGFDLTFPVGIKGSFLTRVAEAPRIHGTAQYQTVHQALESGPMCFVELMEATGSQDGREIALELDDLLERGLLVRLEDGEYALAENDKI